MRNLRSNRVLVEPVDGADFLAALPIINAQGTVGILVNHVDGTRQLQVLIVDAPLGPVGTQIGCVGNELHEILPFDAGVPMNAILGSFKQISVRILGRKFVVVHEALNVVVEVGSGAAHSGPIVGPLFLDLVGGQPPVLVSQLPRFARHHLVDDIVCVELGEVGMNPSGHGSVLGIGVRCNAVLVVLLEEEDVCIALMAVRCG